MRWEVAAKPEVIDRPDEPFTEVMLPKPIYKDTGGERVFGIGDPTSKLQSSLRRL